MNKELSLEQLVEVMTKECGLLLELQAAKREADLRVSSCHHTINDLQKKIDNRVKKMSEDAIHESYWGQKVRDTR